MTTTYDLTREALAVADALMDSEGVVTEEIDAMIDAYAEREPLRAGKMDALYAVRDRLEAEKELIDAEIQALRRRSDALKAGAKRIGERATALLEADAGIGSGVIRSERATYYLRHSEALSAPDDVSAWPEGWTRIKVSPDRSGALRAIKAGAPAPVGFAVVTRASAVRRRG